MQTWQGEGVKHPVVARLHVIAAHSSWYPVLSNDVKGQFFLGRGRLPDGVLQVISFHIVCLPLDYMCLPVKGHLFPGFCSKIEICFIQKDIA